MTVETPAAVFPSSREIVWRIRPSAEGTYRLLVHFPRGTAPKTLLVSDGVGRRSPLRPTDRFLEQVLNPSEPPVTELPGVDAIALEYPERPMTVLGWNVGWSGIYLTLTLAFAFALKGRFGVEM